MHSIDIGTFGITSKKTKFKKISVDSISSFARSDWLLTQTLEFV